MKLNIPIGEDWLITSDKLNVIVNKRFAKYDSMKKDRKPTGEYQFREVSFHPTIERACNYILNQKISTSDALSLAEVVEVVERHRKELETILARIEQLIQEVNK